MTTKTPKEVRAGFISKAQQAFSNEAILENVNEEAHPFVMELLNSKIDLKDRIKKLEGENKKLQGKIDKLIEDLEGKNKENQEQINKLKDEKSIEIAIRQRLSDRNDYLAQSSLASGFGGLVSFLWLCKDICNVSKINLALFFLILATFGAFWVFVSSLFAFWHNDKQMNKIQKDYQAKSEPSQENKISA